MGGSRQGPFSISARLATSILGAVGTALLHLALLAPSMVSGAWPRSGALARLGTVSEGTVIDPDVPQAMVLLDLSGVADEEHALVAEIPALDFLKPNAPIKIVAPEPIPSLEASADEAPVHESLAGDPNGDALIFSRYLAQVSARIYRAWLRPRDPLDSEMFECSVRIEQDRAGIVQSVELQHCDANSNWQQSLVFAIERASPLTAPPTQTTFSTFLDLKFSSFGYIPGISNESDFMPLAVASTGRSRPGSNSFESR